MDLIIQFLLDHSEKFGAAGVFIGAVGLYFAMKFWKLVKWQRTRISELTKQNSKLEEDYREYIKESLPPGVVSDTIKESLQIQGKTLSQVQHIHRDLHNMRLVKNADGSILLTPGDTLCHDHGHDDGDE